MLSCSLYERSNGSYYGNFSADGERKRISLRTKSEPKARRKLAELQEAHERGEFDPFADGPKSDPTDYKQQSGDRTVSDLIELFAKEKEREGCSERTIGTYRSVWSRFTERVGEEAQVSDLSARDVEDFVYDGSVSDATRHKRFRHVRAVLRWGEGAEDLLDDVSAPKRPDKLPTPVTKSELSAICEALTEDYREKRRRNCIRPGQIIWCRPVFRFVFFTGLRSKEVGRLKWKHIDRERGLIRFDRQKSGKEGETIPLISKAESALQNTPTPRGPDCYVFRSPSSPLRDRNAQAFGGRCSRRFRRVREEAGVEGKTLHDLRAGFGTALANAGLSAHQIRDAMRHSDVSVSLRYVKISNQRLKSDMEGAFS